MKKNLALLSFSTMGILLFWGLSFFTFSFILQNELNWITGKPYSGFINLFCFMIFLSFSLALYFLTGGEKGSLMNSSIQSGLYDSKEIDLNTLTKRALNEEEEFLFSRYKNQLSGPSLFRSGQWKSFSDDKFRIRQKDKSNPVQEIRNESTREFIPRELGALEKKSLQEEDTFLELDLEDISKGLVEIPNPVIYDNRNSLEKNIDVLLEEQNKILDPDCFLSKSGDNSLPDTFKSDLDSKSSLKTSKSSCNELDQSSYPPLPILKVVHLSDQP